MHLRVITHTSMLGIKEISDNSIYERGVTPSELPIWVKPYSDDAFTHKSLKFWFLSPHSQTDQLHLSGYDFLSILFLFLICFSVEAKSVFCVSVFHIIPISN